MNIFYSPEGNPEIWEIPPKGYISEEDFLLLKEKENNELDVIFKRKLKEINDKCSDILSSLSEPYPKEEVLTFERQEREAKEYKSDNSALVPFIRSLSKSRKINLDELVEKILNKAFIYSQKYGSIIGMRQKYEKVLWNLKSNESTEQMKTMNIDYENG